jgi:hypothetical protein
MTLLAAVGMGIPASLAIQRPGLTRTSEYRADDPTDEVVA